MTPVIDVKDVTRTFGSGPSATAALRGVTMTVGEGQLVALRGRSGSGKTALLATHDPTLMDIADSVLHLTDGTIQRES